jgi:lipoprotein-releasing system permease protein
LKFAFYIAKRYLISKKSNNIINWITGISVGVIAIVTAAIVVILSAMNGLSETVMGMYANFDPDLKITTKKGKFTSQEFFKIEEIQKIPGVVFTIRTIEETVLLKYKDNQEVAVIKGVDSGFETMTGIENYIIEGFYATEGQIEDMCIVGSELAYQLGISTSTPQYLGAFIPNLEGNFLDEGDYFKSIYPKPVGIFDINTDFNSKFVVTNLDYVRVLLDLDNEISALEIGIENKNNLEIIRKKIQKLLGDDFIIKSRFEQNEFLFKSINTEKWITLLILSLVVLLAIFNVIGSLTMLIIDKTQDIFILQSMGASLPQIKTIFWIEGGLIALVGSLIGSFIGWVICFIQIQSCFIGYGVGGKIDCFPIVIFTSDILISIFLVLIISIIFTAIPVSRIKQK